MSTPTAEVTAAIEGARKLLAAWTVAQYLDERDTLGEILTTLAKNDILSAPVVEKASGRYSGFVDVAGILSIFVKGCRRWLSREYGTGMGSETPAMPPTGQNETVGFIAGALREEGYAMKDENALLTQLQSTMGGGMFQRTLRAARLDFPPGEDAGDGEAIYRGYLQASLLSVVSAAFLHPITERRLKPPSLAGTLACNHRVGVYDFDPTFDDGSKVTDLSTFEIVSQSDVIRFLHAHRDHHLLAPFMTLAVKTVGLLRTQHSRRHERDQREPQQQQQQPRQTAAGATTTTTTTTTTETHATASSTAATASPPRSPPEHSVRPGLSLPGYHYRGVLCVPAAATTALDAFALMDAEGISALGVCDDSYRIVANISVSDLRGIKPEAVDRLALPVAEFLRRQRAGASASSVSVSTAAACGGGGGGDDVSLGVVACGVDSSIGDVIELMVTRSVHHVYVCSSDRHPLAVVTPHDVLRLVADRLVEG